MNLRQLFSNNLNFWLVAIAGFISDQVTKLWIVRSFKTIGTTQPLWENVFHFTYVTNDGAAFSFFAGGVAWLRWLSLLVSLGLMFYGLFSPRLPKWEQLGLGFILAGAMGNGLDRFLFGYVVDFLDFRLINFPIFNLADVWINVGIVCMLLAAWLPDRPSRPPDNTPPSET
ncbi:MAG: signal peptidase II [Cyanobacteria bacterium P01_H01_bin.15]